MPQHLHTSHGHAGPTGAKRNRVVCKRIVAGLLPQVLSAAPDPLHTDLARSAKSVVARLAVPLRDASLHGGAAVRASEWTSLNTSYQV